VQTIDIGDFRVLNTLATAETESDSKTEIILNKIEKETKDNIITHIYPKIDSGNGSANNYIFLTEPTAPYLDANYPLEALGDLIFLDGQTKRLHNVVNKKAVDLGYQRKQKDEVYTSIQEFDQAGVPLYSTPVLQELAYRKAVKTLRAQGQQMNYKLDVTYKRLILPCSKIYIKNFVSYYVNKFGQNEIINIKDETFYQNNIDVELTNL